MDLFVSFVQEKGETKLAAWWNHGYYKCVYVVLRRQLMLKKTTITFFMGRHQGSMEVVGEKDQIYSCVLRG